MQDLDDLWFQQDGKKILVKKLFSLSYGAVYSRFPPSNTLVGPLPGILFFSIKITKIVSIKSRQFVN